MAAIIDLTEAAVVDVPVREMHRCIQPFLYTYNSMIKV